MDSVHSSSDELGSPDGSQRSAKRSDSLGDSPSHSSATGMTKDSGEVTTKMHTFDSSARPKERVTHLRQSSEDRTKSTRKSFAPDGSGLSDSPPFGDQWEDNSMKSATTDDLPRSGASERPDMRHLKLALPTRKSTRGTLIYAPGDDDSVNNETSSDSAHSQGSIPDVPVTARNRSGSLTAFYRLLYRYIRTLEETPPSGISPPRSSSNREATSRSAQSSASSLPTFDPSLNARPNGPRNANSSQLLGHLPVPSSSTPTPTNNTSTTNATNETLGETAEATVLKNRIAALEWLITSVAGDPFSIHTLDQVIRNRDMCENRRPYSIMVEVFTETDSDTLRALSLDLINILLGDIPLVRRIEFFELLENSTFLNGLNIMLASDKYRSIARTFQRLYIEHLSAQSNINWDPRFSQNAKRMAQLMKDCHPLNVYPLVVWETCSRLSFLGMCYAADHYPAFIRSLLDENEAQTVDTYCLPLVASALAQILCDLISQQSPAFDPRTSLSSVSMSASSSYAGNNPLGSAESESQDDADLELSNSSECIYPTNTDAGNNSMHVLIQPQSVSAASSPSLQVSGNSPRAVFMLGLLFSKEDAFNELFCMLLFLFDAAWKDSLATTAQLDQVLEQAKHLFYISCETVADWPTLKSHLLLTSKLSLVVKSTVSSPVIPPKSGSPRATSPFVPSSMSSASISASAQNAGTSASNEPSRVWRIPNTPLSPTELRAYFVELVRWVTMPADRATLQLLADAVGAMRTLATQSNFPWDVANEHMLFYLLRNIGGSDGSWVRQLHLSSQVALWIDYQVNNDPRGPAKLVNALEIIASDHSEGYCYTKPLVRMLRSNRQLSIPLRIINSLFEHKEDEFERKAYLSDLARSQALSIMKSKVWSTFAEVRHELLRFQRNLLSSNHAKFDPNSREHEALLFDIWHKTFPLMKLKHVGPVQWALLGFRKCMSLNSFRGLRLMGLNHLLHFARTQTVQMQHLILCPGSAASVPAGDMAISLSNLLLKLLTTSEFLMPMIFDEDRDGFADMHSVSMLWIIQTWLLDQVLTFDALLTKAEAHIVSVMKNNKPSTADEFSQQMGVSNELIANGWAKIIDRHSAASGLHTSTPPPSAFSIPHAASSSSLNSAPSSRSLSAVFSTSTPPPGTNSVANSSDSLLDSSSSNFASSSTPPPTGNATKLRKMLGTARDSPDHSGSFYPSASYSPGLTGSAGSGTVSPSPLYGLVPQESDFLQDYFHEHRAEFQQREHEMAQYIETHNSNAKKGRQRGSSRAERELVESERLSRTIAARRFNLTPETIAPLSDDDKHIKEIAKQRKAENKEQKELKAALAKHKPFRIPA